MPTVRVPRIVAGKQARRRRLGNLYQVHGSFTRGQQAASALLSGFTVDVESLFAAADEVPE